MRPFLALLVALGCGDEPVAEEVAPPVKVAVELPVPDWSEEDMAIWKYAKANGVHGTKISRRAVGDFGLFVVTEEAAEIPPIHAGPSAEPSIWVVRSGDALFGLNDPAMAQVLSSSSPEELVKFYGQALNWMGATDQHAIERSVEDGIVRLSWIHSVEEYPVGPSWERVTVTATKAGTRSEREYLKGYVRPE